MCGITGWVDFNQDLSQKKKEIKAMTEKMIHRGPDATGFFFDKHVAFGHKRLIVIDPEGGKQPMTIKKDNKTYTICYNGELYNTDELRQALQQKGYHFSSYSDTEVLLTSYVAWGEKCVDHFNGIYAFSIWDAAKEMLFAARDRLGVKPYFYCCKTGQFLFASEPKCFFVTKEIEAKIDRSGICELIGLGPSHTPGHGIFTDVRELRGGHALSFSKKGLKIWRYWNVNSYPHEDSLEETLERVRILVMDAVKRQLVSDVPLCTFLSGGLDSSLITAVAANAYREKGEVLHTYSIEYEGNEQFFCANEFQPNSDDWFIQLMSDTFYTKHHRCVITQQELFDALKESVKVRDIPGMADIDSSLYWFCQQIRKDFVVGLSGECADEIFGGYPWFYRKADLESGTFPWMRSIGQRTALLQEGWKKKLALDEYLSMRYEESVQEVPLLDGETDEERFRRILFYLNMVWFMPTLLDRKDRTSMGASLEVRVPFSDHHVVEYAWNIPWSMKNLNNREKGLLREAFKNDLPKDIVFRKKRQYPKTHHPLYTELVTGWLKEVLKNKDSILYELFDAKKLHELADTKGAAFQLPFFGQLMTGPQFLAYLCQLDYWAQLYAIQITD